MPKRNAKINVILYLPSSQDGKEELAQRIASVHADAVLHQIKKLECPSEQKTALLNSIIFEAKKKGDEQHVEATNSFIHTQPSFLDR